MTQGRHSQLEVGLFIRGLANKIPEHDRERILKKKKADRLTAGTVRAQIYVPTDLYVVLRYYSAFMPSESAYFSRIAQEDVLDTMTSELRNGLAKRS